MFEWKSEVSYWAKTRWGLRKEQGNGVAERDDPVRAHHIRPGDVTAQKDAPKGRGRFETKPKSGERKPRKEKHTNEVGDSPPMKGWSLKGEIEGHEKGSPFT